MLECGILFRINDSKPIGFIKWLISILNNSIFIYYVLKTIDFKSILQINLQFEAGELFQI